MMLSPWRWDISHPNDTKRKILDSRVVPYIGRGRHDRCKWSDGGSELNGLMGDWNRDHGIIYIMDNHGQPSLYDIHIQMDYTIYIYIQLYTHIPWGHIYHILTIVTLPFGTLFPIFRGDLLKNSKHQPVDEYEWLKKSVWIAMNSYTILIHSDSNGVYIYINIEREVAMHSEIYWYRYIMEGICWFQPSSCELHLHSKNSSEKWLGGSSEQFDLRWS